MRVLLYSEAFYPSVGGGERIAFDLARGLAKWPLAESGSGTVEVTVVTQTVNHLNDDQELPFRIVRRPTLRKLFELTRRTDVVHLAGPALLPLAAGLMLRKPVVVEHHGFQVSCPNGQLFYEPEQTPCEGHYMAKRYGKCVQCNRARLGLATSLRMLLLTPLRRWLSDKAIMNITPTQWLGSVLRLRRMTTVYHGLSLNPTSAPMNRDNSVFAFQGRLVTTKGVDLLLQAAERLREEGLQFTLKIIGEGPERNYLQTKITSSNPSVQFLGFVPDERLEAELSGVGSVVMPSQGGEVFGLVAAENMLRGKVLIVSDIGALVEIIGDTGLTFVKGDVATLVACMRHVLDSPSLVTSLGDAARARAIRLFGLHSMIESHISLYRQISH